MNKFINENWNYINLPKFPLSRDLKTWNGLVTNFSQVPTLPIKHKSSDFDAFPEVFAITFVARILKDEWGTPRCWSISVESSELRQFAYLVDLVDQNLIAGTAKPLVLSDCWDNTTGEMAVDRFGRFPWRYRFSQYLWLHSQSTQRFLGHKVPVPSRGQDLRSGFQMLDHVNILSFADLQSLLDILVTLLRKLISFLWVGLSETDRLNVTYQHEQSRMAAWNHRSHHYKQETSHDACGSTKD